MNTTLVRTYLSVDRLRVPAVYIVEDGPSFVSLIDVASSCTDLPIDEFIDRFDSIGDDDARALHAFISRDTRDQARPLIDSWRRSLEPRLETDLAIGAYLRELIEALDSVDHVDRDTVEFDRVTVKASGLADSADSLVRLFDSTAPCAKCPLLCLVDGGQRQFIKVHEPRTLPWCAKVSPARLDYYDAALSIAVSQGGRAQPTPVFSPLLFLGLRLGTSPASKDAHVHATIDVDGILECHVSIREDKLSVSDVISDLDSLFPSPLSPDRFAFVDLRGSFVVDCPAYDERSFYRSLLGDRVLRSFLRIDESSVAFVDRACAPSIALQYSTLHDLLLRTWSIPLVFTPLASETSISRTEGPYPPVPPLSSCRISVSFRRVPDQDALRSLIDVVTCLLSLYERRQRHSPVYEATGREIKREDSPRGTAQDDEETQLQRLTRMAPEIFSKLYGSKCMSGRQPSIYRLTGDAGLDNEARDRITSHVFVQGSKRFARPIMYYPLVDPLYIVYSDYPDHPYPGLQPNRTVVNRAAYPDLPCLFKEDQFLANTHLKRRIGDLSSPISPRSLVSSASRVLSTSSSLLVPYLHDATMVVNGTGHRKGLHVFRTDRILPSGRLAVLPDCLNLLLRSSCIADSDACFYRMGVPQSQCSVLSCVMQAVSVSCIDVARLRRELAILACELPGLCAQEMYDTTTDVYSRAVADETTFLDPTLWFRLVEHYFSVNLFVFTRTDRRDSVSFDLPRHHLFHVPLPKRRGLPTIAVYRHATHCELIAQQIRDGDGTRSLCVFGDRMCQALETALRAITAVHHLSSSNPRELIPENDHSIAVDSSPPVVSPRDRELTTTTRDLSCQNIDRRGKQVMLATSNGSAFHAFDRPRAPDERQVFEVDAMEGEVSAESRIRRVRLTKRYVARLLRFVDWCYLSSGESADLFGLRLVPRHTTDDEIALATRFSSLPRVLPPITTCSPTEAFDAAHAMCPLVVRADRSILLDSSQLCDRIRYRLMHRDIASVELSEPLCIDDFARHPETRLIDGHRSYASWRSRPKTEAISCVSLADPSYALRREAFVSQGCDGAWWLVQIARSRTHAIALSVHWLRESVNLAWSIGEDDCCRSASKANCVDERHATAGGLVSSSDAPSTPDAIVLRTQSDAFAALLRLVALG